MTAEYKPFTAEELEELAVNAVLGASSDKFRLLSMARRALELESELAATKAELAEAKQLAADARADYVRRHHDALTARRERDEARATIARAKTFGALKETTELLEETASNLARANKALGELRWQLKDARCAREVEAHQAAKARAERDEARAKVESLDGRRREMRQLLHRMVKYVVEDRAETPGKTRLARLTEQVRDYLNRTADPADILRGDTAPKESE